VPRPKPPERFSAEWIATAAPDEFVADLAVLDVPDYRRFIKRRAAKLIEDYFDAWKRQGRRGRKEETARNTLINALARLFQEQSGWESRYDEKEYRVALRAFILVVLSANNISAEGHRMFHLRLINPALRKPRS
jgi:hypothetical protein